MKKLNMLLFQICLMMIVTACQPQEKIPSEVDEGEIRQYTYHEINAQEITGFQIIHDLERTPVLQDEALFKEVANILRETRPLEEGAASEEVVTEQGMVVYLKEEREESKELVIYLAEQNQRLTLGPTGMEYVIESKALRDFITRDFHSEFVIVEEEVLPEEAREWLEGFGRKKGAYVYQHPDGTYIKIIAGEKPTGGYSIKVTDYDQEAYPRRITIEEVTPGAEDTNTQALTYPEVMVRVKSDQASQYQVVTIDGEKYEMEEKLIFAGLEKPEKNSEITSPLQVKGKIIAFEGSFVVRIIDASGKIVHEAVVQAEAGGPQWGSFDDEIVFTAPDSETGSLELGEYSQENGSFQLRLKIPVRFK